MGLGNFGKSEQTILESELGALVKMSRASMTGFQIEMENAMRL